MGSNTSNKDISSGQRIRKRRCEGKNKDGSQCRGSALTGASFCTFHSPSRRVQERVRRGRLAGGRIPRAKMLVKEAKEIRSLDDAHDVLNKTYKDLCSGRITHQTARTTVDIVKALETVFQLKGETGAEIPVKLYDVLPRLPDWSEPELETPEEEKPKGDPFA